VDPYVHLEVHSEFLFQKRPNALPAQSKDWNAYESDRLQGLHCQGHLRSLGPQGTGLQSHVFARGWILFDFFVLSSILTPIIPRY
jgi:hypothetical protein